MSAKERKRAQTRVRNRAQKSAKGRKGALPRKNCKQPGLKQPDLETPKFARNLYGGAPAHFAQNTIGAQSVTLHNFIFSSGFPRLCNNIYIIESGKNYLPSYVMSCVSCKAYHVDIGLHYISVFELIRNITLHFRIGFELILSEFRPQRYWGGASENVRAQILRNFSRN